MLHLTLTTGHRRESPRSEVADHVVAMLRPVVLRALHGPARVPGGAVVVSAVREGTCATVALRHEDGTPLLTLGLAPGEEGAAATWRALHDGAATPLATSAEEVPPIPWCADRLETGLALHSEVAAWTGDLARCLYWTWAEVVARSSVDM